MSAEPRLISSTWLHGTGLPAWRAWIIRSGRHHPQGWLLAAALVVYLLTRLVALANYPIYFFTDEANQTLLALDFWRDGLRGYTHEFLPTYFQNVYQYNLSVSVYLQLIPALIFGRSIELTRGVPALITALAPLWLGLAMKDVYRSPYPWLAALLLACTPAWLLHSRTAFETGLAVTFYTGFLVAYLRYRAGQPKAIYAAVLAAALAFYTYSPAQPVILLTSLLFLLFDLGYHRRNGRVVLRAFGLALICALPYLRFQLNHPGESLHHLAWIGSYWFQAGSLVEKLGTYAGQYLHGLDPAYWFAPGQDMARHVMGPYGHLLIWTLPFSLAGVGLAVWRFRRWEYRIPLLALLAAPSGAALVGMGITRALFLVVPVALLTGLLAAELLGWAARRWPGGEVRLTLGTWVLLAGMSFYLVGDALINGSTWSTDYGLGGLQYGARQVFGEVQTYTREHPDVPVVISPAWANGTDVVFRFFIPDPRSVEVLGQVRDPAPVKLAGIDSWLVEKHPLDDRMLFILPPEEFERAQTSLKFSQIQVDRILAYPDGKPGFYFVHLRYVENIDQIMQVELEDRRALITGETIISGQSLPVQVSRLDMGEIKHIFDGDLKTFMRTMEANPLLVRIQFPVPKAVHGLVLQIGGTASTLAVVAQVAGETSPRLWNLQVDESPLPRPLEVDFGEALDITSVEIRLSNTHDPEPGHVHLWELGFR